MEADKFLNYILGFIFFKYLSEKMHLYVDELLKADNISFMDLNVNNDNDTGYLEAVKEDASIQMLK